jgi:hypothetical protein
MEKINALGTGGSCFQEAGGGSRVKTSPGKWFTRPCLEKTHHEKRAGRVAQGEGPEFKPQSLIKKKKKQKAKTHKLGRLAHICNPSLGYITSSRSAWAT